MDFRLITRSVIDPHLSAPTIHEIVVTDPFATKADTDSITVDFIIFVSTGERNIMIKICREIERTDRPW